MKYTVKKDQNLIDIALQEFGSVEGLINICKDNSLQLEHALNTNDILTIDESSIVKLDVVGFFHRNLLYIATGQEFISGSFDDSFDDSFE
jgi:hypothetical protein